MILIADSGLTPTDGCVADGDLALCGMTTRGTNPFFQLPEEILLSNDKWIERGTQMVIDELGLEHQQA